MRRGPSDGYDFPPKRDYRRCVWAIYRDGLRSIGVPVAESHALLMPSLEGDEIEVALNAGFREEHLHIVDMNAAIVATLKRRYPKVNTYGVSVSEAIRRISRSGIKLRAANLDFCGQLSKAFITELGLCALDGSIRCSWKTTEEYVKVAPHGAFAPECFVAVTMLRGREGNNVTGTWKTDPILDSFLEQEADKAASIVGDSPIVRRMYSAVQRLGLNDRKRVGAVKTCLEVFPPGSRNRRWSPEALFIRGDYYKSTNGQTMLWSAWKVVSAPTILATVIASGNQDNTSVVRQVAREGILDAKGQLDDCGARIWRETLPILRKIAQAKGVTLTDKDLCSRVEMLMGLTVAA